MLPDRRLTDIELERLRIITPREAQALTEMPGQQPGSRFDLEYGCWSLSACRRAQRRLGFPREHECCQLDADRPRQQGLDVDPPVGKTQVGPAEDAPLDALTASFDGLGQAPANGLLNRPVHNGQRKRQLKPAPAHTQQVAVDPQRFREPGWLTPGPPPAALSLADVSGARAFGQLVEHRAQRNGAAAPDRVTLPAEHKDRVMGVLAGGDGKLLVEHGHARIEQVWLGIRESGHDGRVTKIMLDVYVPIGRGVRRGGGSYLDEKPATRRSFSSVTNA